MKKRARVITSLTDLEKIKNIIKKLCPDCNADEEVKRKIVIDLYTPLLKYYESIIND